MRALCELAAFVEELPASLSARGQLPPQVRALYIYKQNHPLPLYIYKQNHPLPLCVYKEEPLLPSWLERRAHLNHTDQCRVAVSPPQERLRAGCGPTAGATGAWNP